MRSLRRAVWRAKNQPLEWAVYNSNHWEKVRKRREAHQQYLADKRAGLCD